MLDSVRPQFHAASVAKHPSGVFVANSFAKVDDKSSCQTEEPSKAKNLCRMADWRKRGEDAALQ